MKQEQNCKPSKEHKNAKEFPVESILLKSNNQYFKGKLL